MISPTRPMREVSRPAPRRPVTVTARCGNRSLTVNDVNVLHLRDGKVTECWIVSGEQQAEDEFRA